MTAATRDRRSEPDEDDEFEEVRWNDRAMFGSFRGLQWWAAVLIAFALAFVGAFIDVNSSKTVGLLFGVVFFVGSVGAVVFVERRSMFGPVVQPPLVVAVVVPLVVLATGDSSSQGMALALDLGKPLMNAFPAMALTTLFTVGIGIARVFLQRDPNRVTQDELDAEEAPRPPKKRPRPVEAEDEVEADERPKRPRKPAPAEDGERPRRPRPSGASGEKKPVGEKKPAGERPSGDRPRKPAGERPRRPRPRDED